MMESAEELFSYIESFTNLEKSNPPYKREYQLERMFMLCSLFSDPQLSCPVIHVAGTKGKGSTASFIASALSAAGFKTGLYTSPHVSSYRERIMIDGDYADESILLAAGNMMRDRVRDLQRERTPTTFELLTLLAFLIFRNTGCSMAVIETGIGGRLDATNVVSPLASVITPIDLDHTDVLGNSFAEIAGEKAGIIKKGAPVFSGYQNQEVKTVLRNAGLRQNSAITFIDELVEEIDTHLSPGNTVFSLKLKDRESISFTLSMSGYFQADNASLAYLVLSSIMPDLAVEKIQTGFRKALLPGRFEIIKTDPALVLDAAHTPLAVTRLIESFKALFPGHGVLLFGSIKGKNHREMAEILSPCFSGIIISTPGRFKESEPERVYASFKKNNPNTFLETNPQKAFEKAVRLSGGKEPLLVTGSFYMVAEIRKLIAASRFYGI